jgi:hypothetical protein
MRQDQYEKLQQLEEKLLDVFLEEADPEHWPGKGLKLGAMDAQTRGDLYWVRKTAASAAVLRGKVVAMIGATQNNGTGTTAAAEPDADAERAQLDDDIKAAEREATRLLADLQNGGGKSKRAFDNRVHGKS